MLLAPFESRHHVKVTDRHAVFLKDLTDIHFPHAKTIVLAQDNLNIHSKAPRYDAFPAAKCSGYLIVSKGSIRPSTAAGLISQNPNLTFCPPNASTAALPTNRLSSTKSPPGSKSTTLITPSDWRYTLQSD